jgi:hypothetical protein
LSKNCYNLNLPKLENVLIPNFKFPNPKQTINGIYRSEPQKIFQDSFLDLLSKNQIYPSVSVIFYTRSNHRGSPHIDGNTKNTGPWSINWNIGSNMILNYYDTDLKNQSKDYILIKENLNKKLSYIPQSPFLLRNDIVHSVDNIDDHHRWAITLRGLPKIEWRDVVNLFRSRNLLSEN